MLKKILAILAMLYAAAALAAVDVNKATVADLDGIKGIGPVMSKRILDERRKSKFKSWEDLVTRVKGLGGNSAAKLSAEGLTVNGDEFKATAATKKEEKKPAKKAEKAEKKEAQTATAAKPAASAKK
jgi:competence protein ComEA